MHTVRITLTHTHSLLYGEILNIEILNSRTQTYAKSCTCEHKLYCFEIIIHTFKTFPIRNHQNYSQSCVISLLFLCVLCHSLLDIKGKKKSICVFSGIFVQSCPTPTRAQCIKNDVIIYIKQ